MSDFDDSYFVLHGKDSLKRHQQHIKDFALSKKYIKRNLKTGNGVPPLEILDIGCADGSFSRLFLELGEVSGVEINQNMAAKSRRFLKAVYETFPVDKSFDVIVIRGTLQHIPDFDEFCGFLRNSLNAGGLFISLANPNVDSLIYRRTGTLPALNVHPGFSSNYQIFSPRILLTSLGSHSYENILVNYPYISSPYAKPMGDFCFGIYALLTGRISSRAFPRNTFNLLAKKMQID